MRRSTYGPKLALMWVFAGAVLITSCGGGGSDSADGTTAPNSVSTTSSNLTADQQAALTAYRDCLTKNGADPDSVLGSGPGGGNFNGTIGSVPGASSPRPGAGGSGPAGAGRGSLAPGDGGGSRPAGAPVSVAPRVSRTPQDQAALSACESLQPSAGGARAVGNADQLRPYLSCLADNGVPVVTQPAGVPTTGAAGGVPPQGSRGTAGRTGDGGLLNGVDRNSPAYSAANEKCSVLLPAGTQLPGRVDGANGAPPATR